MSDPQLLRNVMEIPNIIHVLDMNTDAICLKYALYFEVTNTQYLYNTCLRLKLRDAG